MSNQKRRRQRGVIISPEGWQKLQDARSQREREYKSGSKYTLEELSELTGLTYNTVAKILASKEGVDKRSLVNFFMAFELELSSRDYIKPNQNTEKSPKTSSCTLHWGDAPDVSFFVGRTAELETLEKWILRERCRLVAILGMGGMGKTALAAKLVQLVHNRFDYVVWRSLYQAPPFKETLVHFIHLLSDEGGFESTLPEDSLSISQLLTRLRTSRCLLILDNCETLFQSSTRTGSYREGYEDYGRLLQQVGEAAHQSCLLLTAREKPKEVALLEGETLPVRSLRLRGLKESEGQVILQRKGIKNTKNSQLEQKKLVKSCTGNPLALMLAATTILELFDGEISEPFKQGEFSFSSIHDLLNEQWERLPEFEKEILYWLAISCRPISLFQLQSELISSVLQNTLIESLESLWRRSLIEKKSNLLTVQPIIQKHITNKFVEQVREEIVSFRNRVFSLNLLKRYALLQANSSEYIQQAQTRLLLESLITQLKERFQTTHALEKKLKEILVFLSENHSTDIGYIGGNILNILANLDADLRGYNLSNLAIWQANLSKINLPNVNFSHADLSKSSFKSTFGRITSVAFSPDEKMLETSNLNGEIFLWKGFLDEELFVSLQAHIFWVRDATFNLNGNVIASGSTDQTVKLWETNTGKCLGVLEEHSERVRTVTFSPEGEILASSGDDRIIKLWSVETGQCIKTLRGHTGRVSSVVFSPQPDTLASCSEDQTLKLWNYNTGQCIKTLRGHTSWVRSVVFSRNGKILASGGDDRTIRLWDVSTGKCLRLLQEHSGEIGTIACSPRSEVLASGSHDSTIKLWNMNSGQLLSTLRGHASWVRSVAFSRNGKILASGGDDQTIRLWDVSTGRCLKLLQGYKNGVYSVAFSPQGTILSSGSDDQTIKLWNIDTGQVLRTLHGHCHRVRTVATSPQGNLLASGCYDSSVRLWNTNTGQNIKVLRGHTDLVKTVAFSPQGTTLASGSIDQTIRLWDVSTGECLRIIEHSDGFWFVAFSPQGTLLASGSDDQTIRLWNVSTGNCLNAFQGHVGWVLSVAFSPRGTLLASGSKDRTIKLWDLGSSQCLTTLAGHASWVLSVAFSQDGQILASGSVDQTVKLWDLGSGECLTTLTGHSHWVWSVAFSPDGKLLASGSEDGTMRLWDVTTGECLKIFRSERPYEGMNLTGVKGLSQATINSLKELGAVER